MKTTTNSGNRTQAPRRPAAPQGTQAPRRPAAPQGTQAPRRPATPQDTPELKQNSSSPSRETSAEQTESLIPKNIRVIGMTTKSSDSERVVVFQSRSSSGLIKDYHINVCDFVAGNRKQISVALVDAGHFDICSDVKALKRTALAILKEAATKNVIVLYKQGFNTVVIEGEKFIVFVYNNKANWVGKKPPVKVIVAKNGDPVRSSGTLDEWIEFIGSQLSGNPYMIVIHSHALAAALRKMFNKPYTSFCLVGTSTVGKSTVQQSAQSLIGPFNDVKSMSGTKVGILDHLQARPDRPVFFQDVRQNDNTDIYIDIVFNSVDGAERMKSGSRTNTISATMLLSNERHVADMKTSKMISLDEGLYARLFEISCCGPYGAFHNLHGHDDPAKFADELKENSNIYYGTVWPEWINKISNKWSNVLASYDSYLPKIKAEIAQKAGKEAHDRVNNRILDALAFSAWAGTLASRMNILPVSRPEIIGAFGLVMKEYIDRQVSGSTPLADQILSEVRGYLDQNLARFHPLASFNDKYPTSNVYGYRQNKPKNGELFLFLANVFNDIFQDKFGSVVYDILKNAGFLVTSKDRGNQYLARIPGTDMRRSFIAIKANIRFD